MGKLVLSPTRTYAPVMNDFRGISREDIHGIIHCSGGGQTKVLNFVNDVHIVKDNMFYTPPLFNIIQQESGTPWYEMYQVFNMGHRFELYVPSADVAGKIIDAAKRLNVEAKVIGHVKKHEGKQLTIRSEHGEFIYQ
jgi:phosphoribosylformylglycinamidine cyclo-ligase